MTDEELIEKKLAFIVVVHGYTSVDPAILRDVVENHLGDIRQFVAAVRARLGR